MQKRYILKKAALYFFLFLFGQLASPLKASHYTFGSEVWATHITKNKYEISYRAYRVCGAVISAPSSVFVVAYGGKSAACGTVSLTASLVSSKAVDPKCSTSVDCNKSYLFKEHLYKCTADLDSSIFKTILSGSTCKNITFAVYGYLYPTVLPCYNWDAYSATTIYLENLANCTKTTNTPPARMFEPIRVLHIDRSAIFNQGLADTAERDVLRYELSPSNWDVPYKNKTCVNTPTKDLSHPFTPTCAGTTLCSANTKTNPVRGTYFDTSDGVFIFTPSVDGEFGVACVKVKEYRINKNGKYTLIAEHQREVAAYVVDTKGDNEPPKALLTQKSVIKVCVGNTIKQKFVDFDDVIAPFQSISDSLQVIVPPTYRGASIKVYSSAKNKRSLEFNWTPTLADTFAEGYVFPIKVVDLHCSEPLSTTYNLIVKVYPQPTGTPQIAYKGCNKLTLNVKNFTGGSAPKVSWQILNSTGNTVGTSNRVSDSLLLDGTGTYKVLALFSNEGGCLKPWDTTISIIDTVINFQLGSQKPFADTLNCPNGSLYLEPKNVTARKGALQYNWYGLSFDIAKQNQIPRNISTSTLSPLGSSKNITVKTNKDTAILLFITDAKGCTEAQQLNITQLFSDPVEWNKSPLSPICASDPPFKLIDPVNKDLLDGGPLTNIRCLNGKYLDSLGPNYYKLRSPQAIKGVDKIRLSLVASYDTLGCISRDTNTIDVMYLPQFDLATTTTVCSGDSAFFPEDAVIKPAKNALPYDWKIIGMPSKSIAQLMPLTVGGRTGTHLVTHLDSIAVGTYKLQACTADSTLGCRSCDTAIIIAKPQIKFQYTGDTLICPNDAPFRLRDNIKLSSGELNDSLYSVSLYAINGNTNPSANVQRVFDKNSSELHPRMVVGTVRVRLESPKYCYADGYVNVRIQDTLPVNYSVSPDSVIRLPRTSFTFTASTTSPRVWWYFGTGNLGDTSTLNPITWSFDSKIADYKVSARSYHNNGCYGEFTRKASIWDVSAINQFDQDAKINQDLQLISTRWELNQLDIFDTQGKLVYRTLENRGAPKMQLAPGLYTYKIRASRGADVVEKSGKWLNFGG